VVLTDSTAAEPLPDQVEDLTSFGILAHVELGNELRPVPAPRTPLYGNVERSFSIDVSRYVGVQPFLLIDRI
jgi:hypothetical protein